MLRAGVVPDFTADPMERADQMDPWSTWRRRLLWRPHQSYARQWFAALVIAGIPITGAAWFFKTVNLLLPLVYLT